MAAVVRAPVDWPEAGSREEDPATTRADEPAEQGFAADRWKRPLKPSVRLRTKSPGKTQHKMHEVATFLTQSSSFLHATGFFHGIHSPYV